MHLLDIARQFIEQPLSNVEDPPYDWFQWYIDFNATNGLFASPESPNSAIAYLNRTGEVQLAKMLTKARSLLRQILQKAKYRVISIDGIDALNDNIRKVSLQTDLTLTMSETASWELRSIIWTLNACYYDNQRQLEVLPENLRRFSSFIYFADAHVALTSQSSQQSASIETMLNLLEPSYKQYSNEVTPTYLEAINDLQRQHLLVQIPHCFITGNTIPGVADNTNSENTVQQFKLSTKWYYVTGLFPEEDLVAQLLSVEQQNAMIAGNNNISTGLTALQAKTVGVQTSDINIKPMLQNVKGTNAKHINNTFAEKVNDIATAAILGQMSTLRNLGSVYIANGLSSIVDNTKIIGQIKNAYNLITNPGLVYGAIEQSIDDLVTGDKVYDKDLGEVPDNTRTETIYKKRLL